MKRFILSIFMLSAACSYTLADDPDFEIPQAKKYQNNEDCIADNGIALKSAKYLLSTELPTDAFYAKKAGDFVLLWTLSTPEFAVLFADELNFGLFATCGNDNEKKKLLGEAYLSAFSIYRMETKKVYDFTFDAHHFAMESTLAFYKKNIEYFGKCKALDKLLKLQEKGKLKDELEKKFNKIIKTATPENTKKINPDKAKKHSY